MSILGLWLLLTTGLSATAGPLPMIDESGHLPPAAASVAAEGLDTDAAAWRLIGPYGGMVNDVAGSPIEPDIVLVGAWPGGYRSTDGGITWQGIVALKEEGIHDIEFAADGTVYAGTKNSVWKSTDDGVSWTQQNLGIGLSDEVFELAIDAGDAESLWAGIEGGLGGQPINVMRSTDGGANWFSVTPPLAEPAACRGIALNPNDSDEVFAVFQGALGTGEVWFSNDGGATWLDRTAGLPGYPMRDAVHDGSRILVGGGRRAGGQYVGLYASSDDGVSWTALHDGTWPFLVVDDVELDPDDSNIMLVATAGSGVHKSTDGGSSWQIGIGGTEALYVSSVRFAPGSSEVVFLGTTTLGVLRSTDSGADFELSSTGIDLLPVESIAANPHRGSELAAAFRGLNEGGVFTSTSAGAGWSLEPTPPTRHQTVRFAPDGTLYATAWGPSWIAEAGVYRRNTDGTWISLGPEDHNVLYTLRFSENNLGLILAGGSGPDRQPVIWRSLDAGQSWTKVYDGVGLDAKINDIEIVEDGTDTEMLATYDFTASGVLRSIDAGASWFESSAGLPGDVIAMSLCSPPGDPDTFYLVSPGSVVPGGLYRTDNGGATWQPTGYSDFLIVDVVCDPFDASVLYIAQHTSEVVLRSEDEGVTFRAFGDGLEEVVYVKDLDIGPDAPVPLLLATLNSSFATYFAADVFADGFESGNTSAWPVTVP